MNDLESISMKGSGGSKMPHSHSTPAGVDGGSRTPPITPRKAGKMLAVRVQMLDDTITMFQVQAKALGRVLFDQVCKQLHLLEADYFGLEYQEPNGTKYWLDLEKPICRQVGLSLIDPLLRFCVKFYTPDPAQLEEEYTRYLFCLQIKRDLAQGLIQCNDNTAALMASYIVQAECGDYVIEDYPDHTYLSTYKFVPHQDQELERRIMENHKKHAGQSPAEADLNLLETARRCELYGMKMHPAKDHESVPLNLAVAHMGIVVFQNYTKINTFSWAKIRKISFKRKRFLIKLHPEGYGYYKDTVEFFFEGRNECKNFWKKCVENHGFFRCTVVKRVVRQKTRVLSRGSSFRYSGKTQKQIVEFVRDNYVKRQTFQRSNSFRQTSGGRALQGLEGGGYRGATPSSSLMGSSSISAHPLLPLGDPALSTPALSLSCGSMTLDSPTIATSVSMGGTIRRREDTATSFRTLTSIDVHSPGTPSQEAVDSVGSVGSVGPVGAVGLSVAQAAAAVAAARQTHATSQQRIASAGRISPSNISPLEFPLPRPMPRHPWQRSASCRELYASSFEDSGKARPKDDNKESSDVDPLLEPFRLPSQGELDNPITRYDESNRSYSAASSKLPSLDHDSVPERVYSSSYPGTSSLSTESGHEGSGPAADLSHDDLSHDSYELLEREHEFEYPESYSSPRDENEPLSDNSDEGIEHEMFQMDSETDSFVKHKSIKPADRHQFKSVLADIKNAKSKSIDRYSAPEPTTKLGPNNSEFVTTESRIQRSSTQIERKFETRHANSIELQVQAQVQPPPPPPPPLPSFNQLSLPHQDSAARKDPVVLQVQKQKMSLLNELKSLKPKYKITHVDSEILRDEGIMRPKSRIDDDLSPVEGCNKTILDHAGRAARTTRARSIASLEDHPAPRSYVETGSLGRGHRSRERKPREVADARLEKSLAKLQEKERRSLEERKRFEREHSSKRGDSREKPEPRERRSVERSDSSRSRRSGSRELRRSVERLDIRERSYERLDSREARSSLYCGEFCEYRGKSVDRLDSRTQRGSAEYLYHAANRSPKERSPGYRRPDDRRERSVERLDSRETRRSPRNTRSYSVDYNQRHTLERFDSGNRSPFERLSSKEQQRGKSVERLDSQESRPRFDFDSRTIERLKSLERSESSKSREQERRASYERNRHADRLETRSTGRSLECLEPELEQVTERRRGSSERLECRDTNRRAKSRSSNKQAEEKPRERDDWRSLEQARKDEERRERERRMSSDTRSESRDGESVKSMTVFTEYEPKVVGGVVLGFEENVISHVPVERTKSDPNPARQRLGSNSKRHMLMHQKSIDLTPADSGDEDPFSDGALVTSSQRAEIPYTLHKRHVMNGTASDEKSESDSGRASKGKLPKDLPKLPLKMITDISCFDLSRLTSVEKPASKLSPDKAKSVPTVAPARPKSILSPSDKPKSILSPTSKLSPTDAKSIVCSLSPSPTPSPMHSPTSKSPLKVRKVRSPEGRAASIDKGSKADVSKPSSLEKRASKLSPVEPNVTILTGLEKRSPKVSPTDPSVTIIAALQKRKSADAQQRSFDSRAKAALNFADVVGLEMKQKLDRRARSAEKDTLKAPDDSLDKQDSIEKIPLPEIPGQGDSRQGLVSPKKASPAHEGRSPASSEASGKAESPPKAEKQPDAPLEKPKLPEKPKHLEKPSIPEKTKRILEKIESKFSEASKSSASKIARPRIIDTGFDDFVDPVADLPLDEVPVSKPALELDSLKVPEFNPFMLKPHAEPLRSKSLSLAEEKAPIDTLLSPEVENKHFVQDVSPKRVKKAKSEPKKDFKKQSKSLEGDKPPLKKSGSKESRSPNSSTKIDKSKLKLGEMPREIIIIDSTEVAPEVSIVQKARSKSVTRLPDKPFSASKEEKEEPKGARAKSVDDELIKALAASKADKSRPKSLGISKSLGSTEKKDSIEKVSPKRTVTPKAAAKAEPAKSVPAKDQKQETAKSPKSGRPDDTKEETGPVVEEQHVLPDFKEAERSDEEVKSVSTLKGETVEAADGLDRKRSSEQNREAARKDLDLTESPIVLRKPGQTPILFARARLGLSEGSGIGALQRQGATQSPTAQRRAKSLDAAVISVHRLPPTNAFSSKDDTVDVSEGAEDQQREENAGSAKRAQMEASPNHRSDSTDHTTVPEIFTDSLSVTETSAQYLESPLSNEIVASADLILPFEQDDVQLELMGYAPHGIPPSISCPESTTLSQLPTKFIDQSSVESAEQERSNCRNVSSSKSESTDRSKPEEQIARSAPVSPSYRTELREDLPDVTVSTIHDDGQVDSRPCDFDEDDGPDMVKSPIQISIEECSDDELVEEDYEREAFDPAYEQEEALDGNRPLDSADTSEDTLDALDTQVQMRDIDSELSSPDYGVDKMDEKTLVEVELTPEYLEMTKEDTVEEAAEELPEDEEPVAGSSEATLGTAATSPLTPTSPNRLEVVDKKLRLSSERSRSEETSTWTPDREDPESSSCSIARPLGIGQIQPIVDRREIAMIRESRNAGLEDVAGESAGPRSEFGTTWKSFPPAPLESSGSSSIEDGWLPQDDRDDRESNTVHSEDSNGQNEDSFQEELADFPGSFVYPIGPDILSNCGTFALTRTLSRISERSTTSEQDRSDLEDSFKPSSKSPSLDDESLTSSDHQPSLSSDPPSGTALPSVSDDRRTSSELPDIPIDVLPQEEVPLPKRPKLQVQSSEDWPSPPSSPVFETPVVSHVETFYMEIKREEAVKVTVTDSTSETPVRGAGQDSDSSDENRTLHDDLHSALLEDAQSSTSATTVDGTVKIVVKPKSNSYITGSSHSEDTSMGLSMSEWSSSNNTVRQFCQYSGTKSDDNSLAELGASISDWSGSTTVVAHQYYSPTSAEKSQSDTTTSDKSVTSMRPNSKCQASARSPPSSASSPSPPLPPLPSLHSSALATPPSPPLTPPPEERREFDHPSFDSVVPDSALRSSYPNDQTARFAQYDLQRRIYEDERQGHGGDLSSSRFRNEYEEAIDEEFQVVPDTEEAGGSLEAAHLPIPEEEEEDDDEQEYRDEFELADRLYDNVPAMKYSSRPDQTRLEVRRGDSSEDMHESYAAGRACAGEDDWSFEEEQRPSAPSSKASKKTGKLERGSSETAKYTSSTERPVLVPIRAKSVTTPYYSTTSLSGESTTSSPPLPTRAQIRTKTVPCAAGRSPQSEGDTSSSMDSPAHTPHIGRGQRAFRRKRQPNMKRRHRVVVDLEVKDGQIVSSTDSSFDVASIPPPLLQESRAIQPHETRRRRDEEEEAADGDDDEYSEPKARSDDQRSQNR